MRLLLSTILLLLTVSTSYSQDKKGVIDGWDKIILVDAYGGWSQFKNEYQIDRSSNLMTSLNREDSVQIWINPTLIDELLNSLSTDSLIKYDPLRMFRRDSLWLINNAQQIWLDYLGKRDEPAEIDSIAVNTIKNYQKVKGAAWGLQGSHWTDDYPYTHLAVISGRDTLQIYSDGQYPYMLPWKVADHYIYNSRISTLIAQLLPDTIKSNKSRLIGDEFNDFLMDRIYRLFLKDSFQFLEAKRKYPRQFEKLNTNFSIKDAELTYMASIEWGGWFGRPCLELILKAPELPNNIRFSVVLGRRGKLYSILPLISKKESIKQQLQNNPVYLYTVQSKGSSGEIHFVNGRSLSGQARREFLSDVKEKGLKKSQFRGKFKKAIFYELEDAGGEKRSFSRWIFLKDGTLILWELRGDFLMNLPSEVLAEKGYVCRIISAEEILKAMSTDR